MAEKRLFIAIPCSEETKRVLEDNISILQEHGSLRPTTPENLHMTVVYVGETTRMHDVKQALQGLIASSFTMEFTELGVFKRPEGNLLWQGVEKSFELEDIFSQISENLQWRGFTNLSPHFTPHITLGRRFVREKDTSFTRIKELLKQPLKQKVDYVALFESTRINGKLVYKELDRVSLEELV